MLPNIKIIYASASGNVEAVANKVSEVLSISRISSSLVKADVAEIELIKDNQFFLFAASTWEHGVINPYFNRLMSEISSEDMNKKYAAFIGLGDTRYEPVHFCEGIEILKTEFTHSGGRQIGTTLKINGSPFPLLDTVVTDWTEQLVIQLKRYVK